MLLEQYFVLKNVRFISINLPQLDTYKDPHCVSTASTHLQSLMNDNYVYETSIKIREKLEVKKKLGLFVGAFPPYGLKRNPENRHQLLPDENVVDICNDILDWIYEGKSTRWVAMRLNELGIPCPSEYKKQNGTKYYNPNVKSNPLWTANVVSEIAKNRMLLGDMVQSKGKIKSHKVHKYERKPKDEWIIVPNTHPAVFKSREKFDIVQELFKNDTKSATGKNTIYLFGGILKCADCGKAMHRSVTKNHVYYKCRTYKEQSKTACTIHSIREDELEQAVLAALNMQLALIENISEMINDISNLSTTKLHLEKTKKALKKKSNEIDKINRMRDNLYIDWKNNIITKDDYYRLRINYDEQLKQVEQQISSLNKEFELLENGVNAESPVLTYYKAHHKIEKLERDVVIKFIERIYIHENKEIDIIFRFSDQIEKLKTIVKENCK